VRGVYTDEDAEFEQMPYAGRVGHGFALFMAFYNRRLVKLAKKKITAGIYGDKNLDESFLIMTSFNPDPSSLKLTFRGVRIWMKLEAKLLFTPAAKEKEEPSMASPLPQSGYYEHA